MKIFSGRMKFFLFSFPTRFNLFCPYCIPNSLIFHLNQITPETETYLDFDVFRQYFAVITASSNDRYRRSKILVTSRSPSATTACRGQAPPIVGYSFRRLIRPPAKSTTSPGVIATCRSPATGRRLQFMAEKLHRHE